MSTSITVEFQVNDLDANYEVVGTSDNYSFQEKLGLGSDIVFAEGDAFVKVVPLKGNYGIFDLRVFAVTDIGVRSPAVIGRIEVLPKELEDTFTFSEINTNQNLDSSVVYTPTYAGDKLEIDCEFGGKSIEFNWSLVPPNGHPQEGNSLSTELLNDTFLSGFKINLFNDGQIIDLEQAGYSETSLAALSSTLQTDKENVQDIFNNYRDFSLSLNEAVFNDLNLSRDVSLQIVSVDRFGREATGIANATNLEPVISNLNYSTKGSDTSFSWESTDTDFKDVKIEVLAVPEGVSLAQEDDLQVSASYLKSLKQAKPYNDFVGAYYAAGDKVIYNEKIYEAIQAHTRGNNEYPDDDFEIDEQTGEVIEGVANWALIGDAINFLYFSSNDPDDDLELKNINEDDTLKNVEISDDLKTFSTTQLWGYKYYYTFQPYDEFGDGEIYNLTKKGLIDKNQDDSILEPILVNVKVDNLRFREVKDDLVFNWDVTDQDGNLVDLNQYKFLFGGQDFPSVLGISGSLYDIHTNQKITGITNGFNSKSLDFDEEGDLVVNANLPSTKVFDQYKYTRELNNSIYKTGGFPSNFGDYDSSQNYVSGDNVLRGGKIYTANTQNNEQIPNVEPGYSTWSASKTYLSTPSDTFSYRKNIYKTINDFGPNSSSVSGLFNEGSVYSVGDIVLSPETDVSVFSETDSYVPGDFVFYSGSIYECLQTIATEENAFPNNPDFWSRADIFNDIACAYFESTANSNSSYPFDVSSDWNKVTPASLAANGQFFQFIIPSYELPISDWSLQDSYNAGSFVVYENDIWSGTQSSENQIPSGGSNYWSNQSNSQDIGLYSTYHSRNYQSGDLVYSNNFVYKCTKDDPVGGPITAITNEGESILSSYEQTNWLPYWELNDQYDDVVFKHIGIPQSGKRNVGIELGIVDKNGKIINQANLAADNPPPYILTEGFNVDSTSEATKVKFNFNYALGFQEKTTKVHLYRSSEPVFDVVDSEGFPLTGANTPFVKSVVGAGDATFGQNITQIIDEPPIPQIDGIDQITGHYYKILPFDDFGSGVLYEATNNNGVLEKVLVYPKRYNSPNPDVMPGRVLRADPTEAAGAVPGPVAGFSGSTAFENFFLNWKAPGSEYQQGSTTLLKQKPNDIDHYEVWASSGNVLYTGNSQGNLSVWAQDQNTGYRKIEGVMYSVGDIPQEFPDPALKISGAENIFNVPANSPSVETVYPGKTNDTKNFWIRAVDFGGNKSPFTGASLDASDDIFGLSLTLGQAIATDITGFETSLTETFTNSIALNPNNPFSENGHWQSHNLFYSGVEYDISANSVDISNGYVWWQTGNTFYNTGSIHPANIENNANFNDGDFVIGRINDLGEVTPAFSVFANALIGTANVANAAIVDAKINDLKADKITAGEISSADIQISTAGSEAGVIRSAGFTGIDYNPSRSGFYISGDGTFAFQGGGSSLSFEDDTLTLRGKLRQTNGFDYDFIDLNVSPNFFNYIEGENYENGSMESSTFIPDDNSPSALEIVSTFRNSSVTQTGVRFRMDVLSGDNRRPVFGYDEFINNGQYNISGFEYNPNNFIDESSSVPTKIASGSFALGKRLDSTPLVHGFDYIIDEAFPGVGLADSVILYVSGVNSSYEKSITITRINDGKIGLSGLPGNNGSSVNLKFAKNASTSITQAFNTNPSNWKDNIESVQVDGFLWSHKETIDYLGVTTTGSAFRIDADAIAEVYVYTNSDISSNNNKPSNNTVYDFSSNGLSINGSSDSDWTSSPDSLTTHGDLISVLVGVASGYKGQTDAPINWITPGAVFSQKTDGNLGLSPTFRGVWNELTEYINIPSSSPTDPGRGDMVYYDNDQTYYICIDTASGSSESPSNSLFWKSFGGQFDSVATDLLLTKEAFITEKLTMGVGGSATEVPHSGIIVSSDFVGGLLNVNTEPYEIIDNTTNFENYDTPGFLLARTDDSVVFDVGGTGIVGQTGYIRFDSKSGKLEIAGSYINNTVIDESVIYTGVFELGQTDELTSFIGGGYNNQLLQESNIEFQNIGSAIVGGAWNKMQGRFSTIAGGYSGLCKDNFSFIGGGWNNTMPLDYIEDNQGANFIGNGISNQISGGAGQTILNGGNNKMIGFSGSYEPVLDFDNDLYSPNILGTGNNSLSEAQGWTTESWIGTFYSAGAQALRGLSQGGWIYNLNFQWIYCPSSPRFAYIDEPIEGFWVWIGQIGTLETNYSYVWYWLSRPDEQNMSQFDINDPNTDGLLAYSSDTQDWVFFDREVSNDALRLYDYSINNWINLN